jgi:homoserine dehydrogenase
LRLALIGYGNVGQAFARLLERKRASYPFRIVGVHTLRHGTAIDPKGLGLQPRFGAAAATVDQFLRASRAEVMIEATTLEPSSGEPAISHIRAAFARHMHVVTSNKGPIAHAYQSLKQEAAAAGVEFRFESVTMDGTPVYNLVRNNLPGIELTGFAGALNSTSKVIIDAMRRGKSFDEGVREAQRLGVAEADASFDTEGWDSAAKAAALANVLMDARTTPQAVDRRGIGRLTPESLAALKAKGKTVVLVSRAKKTSQGVRLRVRAEVLEETDLLASVQGTSNLLILETDLMGKLGVFTIGPRLEQTAYGLFSDLTDIARSL